MTATERAKMLAVGVLASVGIGFAIFVGSVRVTWWFVRGTPESKDRRYRQRTRMTP